MRTARQRAFGREPIRIQDGDFPPLLFPPKPNVLNGAPRIVTTFQRTAIPLRQIGGRFIGGLQEIEQCIIRVI